MQFDRDVAVRSLTALPDRSKALLAVSCAERVLTSYISMGTSIGDRIGTRLRTLLNDAWTRLAAEWVDEDDLANAAATCRKLKPSDIEDSGNGDEQDELNFDSDNDNEAFQSDDAEEDETSSNADSDSAPDILVVWGVVYASLLTHQTGDVREAVSALELSIAFVEDFIEKNPDMESSQRGTLIEAEVFRQRRDARELARLAEPVGDVVRRWQSRAIAEGSELLSIRDGSRFQETPA
jgi:hypothetical protein